MYKIRFQLSQLALLVFGFSFSIAAFAAEGYTAPRTEWGQPDFQGVWNFSSSLPMERPEHFGEREFLNEEEITAALAPPPVMEDENAEQAPLPAGEVGKTYDDFWNEQTAIGGSFRTSHIVYPKNGRVPQLQDGVAVQFGTRGSGKTAERPARHLARGIGTDGPEDRGLSERCLLGFNAGPPFTPSVYNNNIQIFQNRDTVVIMTEMIHEARIVPLYGSADDLVSLHDDIRLYSGDSRGYWEGDTLVVVSKNFNTLTASFTGIAADLGLPGNAYDKVLTEKFTRKSASTIDYEFTVNDLTTYTDKFTAIVSMSKVDGLLYEYACHEGNYGMTNILRGARVQERRENSEQ
tara:strand:+ start:1418 stop:2464 length:1047 start_codon:yes stop_codon:yes gene_type:complete